ncbi:SEC24B [Cordylochernes scorpioides]|uniref:SEC24B n=1 Tax=Cordylochernes scorpioides TaxID=51811 RepID=A0ABY6KLK3_9ARAC|nr:SEC24B [Cordylochernes scorpioides]
MENNKNIRPPNRYLYQPYSGTPQYNPLPNLPHRPNTNIQQNYENSSYQGTQGQHPNQVQPIYQNSAFINSLEPKINHAEVDKAKLANSSRESPVFNNHMNANYSPPPPMEQPSKTSQSHVSTYKNYSSPMTNSFDTAYKGDVITKYPAYNPQQPKNNASPATNSINSQGLHQAYNANSSQYYSEENSYATYQNSIPQTPNSTQSSQTYKPQANSRPYTYGNNYERDQQLASSLAGMSIHGSFSRLWGHESINLLQERNILPPQEEPPSSDTMCDPNIFCSTLSKIPETHSLLQKSRLPLGILIHPFKDIDNLPVIQCGTIVRCRACRAYINPYITFIDQRRWKCNLCFRVNDIPEEFLYDPLTRNYGDPSRRPEIKNGSVEFIAPSEYMVRPPQPAIYLFVLDVSMTAIQTGYLQQFCDTLAKNLDHLPGDSRTQVGFITFNNVLHFYDLGEEHSQPQVLVVSDLEEVYLPRPDGLLVNLHESRSLVLQLLELLPALYARGVESGSCLGPALQAAYKLMCPSGGRITVIQTCLPTIGPGALKVREDPNLRASQEVPPALLGPSNDFYKKLSLDCIGDQVAMDLFMIGTQYADLATLGCIPKFSAGCLYYYPGFSTNLSQKQRFELELTRYLTRKVGFEAVMRVRCTRGLTLHTFHGNCFVRSSDLLSLANVNPDLGFAMQLSIDESLSEVKNASFQAALLYTTSAGERRIRVHTISHPVTNLLVDIFGAANHQAIVGLISKMAVDRTLSSSLSDAREALINACVDLIGAYHLTLPASQVSGALVAPYSARLLPLYANALLKHPAFRVSVSTKLDDRVYAMEMMKILPISHLLPYIYPSLYSLTAPNYPQLQLSCEKLDRHSAYLLVTHHAIYLYLGTHASYPEHLQAFLEHKKIGKYLPLIEVKENSPEKQLVLQHMVDDRSESQYSYYEFLQHLKLQTEKRNVFMCENDTSPILTFIETAFSSLPKLATKFSSQHQPDCGYLSKTGVENENKQETQEQQSLFDRMKEVLKIPLEMDFDSYADADNDVVTNAMLSDVEIVESILQAKEEEETDQVDEEVDPIVHIPHPKEVLESIQTLRLFLQCQDESKSLHRHLSDLDNIEKSVLAGVAHLKTKMVLVDNSLRHTCDLHPLGTEADAEEPGLQIQGHFAGGEHLPEQGRTARLEAGWSGCGSAWRANRRATSASCPEKQLRRRSAQEMERGTSTNDGLRLVLRMISGAGIFLQESLAEEPEVLCVQQCSPRLHHTSAAEWHRVVFSDESRFCLSSDSRRVRVWRRRGERSNPAAIVERPTVRQRGIMVWGAIAYDSRSPLLLIQGTMTAQRYVDDVLRPVTLPYLQGVPNALYQQDNARPHTARISQQALQDVQMLPWPPYSPDLSPIEHVWDIIGRRLHALPQPRSEDELWQMVEREWRAIPQDAIRTLIDSLPRRVAACIAVRGGPTCY